MSKARVLNNDLHFELGIFDKYCQSLTGSSDILCWRDQSQLPELREWCLLLGAGKSIRRIT